MFWRSAASELEPYWRLLCPSAAFMHLSNDAMPPELLLVLLVLLVLLLVAGFAAAVLAQKSRGKRAPPGPFPWPLVGNVKLLQRLSRELGGQHEALLELSRRYGSPVVSLRLGGQECFVVNGADCIGAVLGSEDYDGRPWNFFVQLRNMGKKKGITMNDGEDWREIRGWFLRSMRSVGFARREMCDALADELRLVLRRVGRVDGLVCQIKPIVVPAIINVLWTFAAGRRFDETKLQYFVGLMERRARAFDMTGGLLSAYPWIRHIAPNYSGYNLLLTVNREFRSMLTETIDEHKRNYVAGSQADLIDMFLEEMYAGKGPEAGFDDDQLVIVLLDVLLAGLNITATTLEFLFLNMLVDQQSQRLLHEEIDRVIGRERLPAAGDRPRMPYAEAVILESQRLTPVVPVIGPRRVLRDSSLLGLHLPRDALVLMNLHSIHSDPELYPEPASFRPQRFLRDGQLLRDDNLLFFGKARARHGVCAGDQDWGYVAVRPRAHVFWWLYSSTGERPVGQGPRPLVIWLQGGPGASSTGYGNFEELGPCDVRLRHRDHTWVKDYNVLFVDNPVGAGFSYAEAGDAFARDNAQIAEDLLRLMRGFYERLPRFREVPVYITSESYGGKMAAEFALVWQRAQRSGAIRSNLRGVGLGDAWISPVDSVLGWAPFLLQTGMVDTDGFERIRAMANRTRRAVEAAQWSLATSLWARTEAVVLQATGNVDFYNVLRKVPGDPRRTRGSRPGPARPGLDDRLLDALMNGLVRRTLGLNATWGSQSDTVFGLLRGDFMRPVTHIVERLLDETDLRVFVYSGQLDLIVDTPGTWLWVENMKWSYSKQWRASPRTPLLADGIIEGYRKSYKNFGFYWINRAGHMVPADNPVATAVVLRELTKN
ncbi:uncharacterized protein LOC131672414 [Phymastichus coffea]|uniref:uncharacterized protein LOC131672414 n=1 Tax=Phymastichus coffea TaxID=108790 RepID=UPI00273AB649|nr:uncharacterized protein LOC131672414 [Phymastichus coffea]